jgi:hypothetical protein
VSDAEGNPLSDLSRSSRSISPTERSDESSTLKMARLLGSAMMANDDSTTDIWPSVYILVKSYSENQVSPRLQGCQSQASGPSKVAPRNPLKIHHRTIAPPSRPRAITGKHPVIALNSNATHNRRYVCACGMTHNVCGGNATAMRMSKPLSETMYYATNRLNLASPNDERRCHRCYAFVGGACG